MAGYLKPGATSWMQHARPMLFNLRICYIIKSKQKDSTFYKNSEFGRNKLKQEQYS
jgi:hypothetical protein